MLRVYIGDSQQDKESSLHSPTYKYNTRKKFTANLK